jgi:glycosyltransferase involved in cell wall biosynthesis
VPEEAMTQPQKPRVCIGVPVYNGENYLAQAIESLLAQTFTHFRIIISDNASTDGTEEICRSYMRRDRRVAYHRNPVNRGAAWNFNRVVDLADAEYFAWAAHDDCYAPEYLARCVAALDATPHAICCYPTSLVIDAQGEVLAAHRDSADATAASPVARFAQLLWHADGCHILFGVMRRAVLRTTRGMGAYPASDMVLLAELGLRGAMHLVDAPLFLWREHAQRATTVATTDAELAAWYAPELTGRTQFRHLTLFANYLRAIARAPLSPLQKLRCAGLMAHWFAVRLPTIQDEVRGNIAGPVRRALRRRAAPSAPDSTSRAA